MNEFDAVLATKAWAARDKARILGSTAVGCAVLTESGQIFTGCNVEHRFRSHDIHAETNAIGSMVASGRLDLARVFVAAERSRFTPCGACMDWIFEFGGPECRITWQGTPTGPTTTLLAQELMPYYPH